MPVINKKDLHKAVRHGERELRAAGGDMLTQLRPRNILRDAHDLIIKFARDDALHEYLGPRMLAVVGVVLGFVLVSAVVSIDMMFRFARFFSGFIMAPALAFPFGVAVWTIGVLG